ncbi:hypothetical protein AB3Y13_22570 [Vibrio alginolyticus]
MYLNEKIKKNLLFLKPFLKEQKCNYLGLKSYFDKSLTYNKDIHWLFILTFPNGGSTALSKLLMTASSSKQLTVHSEGQWLVPSLSADGKRWDGNHTVWKRKLRACWLDKIGDTNSKQTLVIEKSPTNICRYNYLISTFSGMKYSLITFTRDPYAVCASWHNRYGAEKIIKTWFPEESSRITSDKEYFSFLSDIWLERAKMIIDAQRESVFNFSYESFTQDVKGKMSQLRSLIPELHDMSDDAVLNVKDYAPQPIINMNERQIKTLTNEQIKIISSSISKSPETLTKLGYIIR